MIQRNQGLTRGLFWITLFYFILGFVSILFANLALLCIFLPFILLGNTKKKVWCQHYCPRASYLNLVGKKHKKIMIPRFITRGKVKNGMFWYFALNLLFIIGSTTQIALGRMEPMLYIRLFIVIPLVPLPQLWQMEAPLFMLHLSYRLYSMMLSTTLLASILAIIYRPRTWCAICPIGTLSTKILAVRKG